MEESSQGSFVTTINEEYETTCWGCGLNLVLPSYAPVFKCGWCGAITNQNPVRLETRNFGLRRFRDRCFVVILAVFMLFVICGGIWAAFPVVFSISLACGIFHSVAAVSLAISTLSTFILIGNCVGAGNHKNFIAFLISAVISTIYAAVMCVYTLIHILPPLENQAAYASDMAHANSLSVLRVVKNITLAYIANAIFVSVRGLVLVYLFVASFSVAIGLSVLLWQQLSYIYEGKTYLSHLSSQGSEEDGEKSCGNLLKFFGCPPLIERYLPTIRNLRKRHKT
ncbi:hypothetical protein IGI04_012044 [Brassica rapa subsp. trilocularis]|uniref:S-acyltransferase n=1 Tax=Brassica rapa subsp. trilocularis TaxID=1813537 RepID=A0ABQ7N783_BRACM|nr:hypothetical protein IGI04_012044 [Brassica rapa subsp. trilocularis]